MTLTSASSTAMEYWGRAENVTPPSDGSGQDADLWTVEVRPTPSDQIKRTMVVKRGVPLRELDPTCGGRCAAWQPEAVIWPAWCPTEVPHGGADMATGTALERVHAYWDRSADRIREAAKWMATVIGLALATLIGTSPFADLSARHPGGWFWVTGLAGLICLALTLLLLTDVLLPGVTSYDAIQMSDRGSRNRTRTTRRGTTAHSNPLQTWKRQVESQQDLWLPSGVKCLVTLREAMIVDELTLIALSDAESKATTIGPDDAPPPAGPADPGVPAADLARGRITDRADRRALPGPGTRPASDLPGNPARCPGCAVDLGGIRPTCTRRQQIDPDVTAAEPIITGPHDVIVLGANLPLLPESW
jgi:hypothetical protein